MRSRVKLCNSVRTCHYIALLIVWVLSGYHEIGISCVQSIYSLKHGHHNSASAVVRSVSALLNIGNANDVSCSRWSGTIRFSCIKFSRLRLSSLGHLSSR